MFNHKNPFTLYLSLLIIICAFFLPIIGLTQLVDPTRPPEFNVPTQRFSNNPQQRKWQLTTTLISPHRRIATINGKKVTSGDIIRGAQVIEIFPTFVKLRNKEHEFTINLLSSKVKKLSVQPR